MGGPALGVDRQPGGIEGGRESTVGRKVVESAGAGGSEIEQWSEGDRQELVTMHRKCSRCGSSTVVSIGIKSAQRDPEDDAGRERK